MTKLLLAFDPGESTGWSTWLVHDDRPMARSDYGLIHGGSQGFVKWILEDMHWALPDRIVSEKFRLGGDTPFPETEPILVEGMIAFYAYLKGIPVSWQLRTMKRQVSDAKLRETGWWLEKSEVAHTDARDVNDSQIHALAWGKLHNMPTLMAYWPDDKDV